MCIKPVNGFLHNFTMHSKWLCFVYFQQKIPVFVVNDGSSFQDSFCEYYIQRCRGHFSASLAYKVKEWASPWDPMGCPRHM